MCVTLLIWLSVFNDPRLLPWAFCSVIATAVIFDIVVELRARWEKTRWVAVWPAHRSYVPELVEQQLLAHNIPVFIRSIAQRRMLHFPGPFLPMDIFVPASRVEAARSKTPSPQEDVSWLAGAVRRIMPLGAVALMLVGAILVQRALRPAILALATPVELEMFRVADDVVLFTSAVRAEAPAGVDFAPGYVPLGGGITERRFHLTAPLRLGDGPWTVRARLDPWLLTLKLPAGTHLHLSTPIDNAPTADEARLVVRSYLLRGASAITGANIVDAIAVPGDDLGEPFVMISLDDEGARRFEQLTRENVKLRIAIVLDGDVVTAPVVQEPITGGEIRISMGSGDHEQRWREARELAANLRAGRRRRR